MQEGKQNIWNAPNILTMLRLLLIPIYWVLMMVRDNETAALIVFVTASITDLLDGYIARHFNQVTDWGKLFDPLADKLMVVSVMMTLVLKGAVPLIILIIIGIKEIIMVAGAACMLRRKIVVYSKPVGKTAQFTMVAGMILAFARALGEFGATIMLAGNIPGKTQTMSTAIYSAVQANDQPTAFVWAGVIITLSLLIMVLMNRWSKRQKIMAGGQANAGG